MKIRFSTPPQQANELNGLPVRYAAAKPAPKPLIPPVAPLDAPMITAPIEFAELAAPAAVTETVLPPLAAAAPSLGPVQTVSATAATPYRIQAGAFSDPANARKAVAQLSVAGAAVIEPIERAGTTLAIVGAA